MRYATKKFGSNRAKASVKLIRAMKMFHMPSWAYSVQIRTTVLESSRSASVFVRSMFFRSEQGEGEREAHQGDEDVPHAELGVFGANPHHRLGILQVGFGLREVHVLPI